MASFVASTCQTRLGAVEVRTYGSGGGAGGGGGAGQLVCLPGMAALGEPDWHAVAARLAAEKFRVTLPLPHSNARTAPSVSEFAVAKTFTGMCGLLAQDPTTADVRESWLLDVLPEGEKVVLAGFSWGGGAACRFAARYPDKISHVVLVSPDVQHMVAQKLPPSVPTLLIWSTNDPINPFFWTRRFRGLPHVTLKRTSTFGHAVLASHADAIAGWLKTTM